MSSSAPLQYRCSTCGSDTANPRNLIVFIDGTTNKPGDKETNVVKLARQVNCKIEGLEQSEPNQSGPEQHGCYFSGLGTSKGSVGEAISNVFEMAFAWNVEKNVKNAYTWLVNNYRKGDRIYLFGFSRGGYQVRALASIIHEVGLVEDARNIDDAYVRYISISRSDPRTNQDSAAFKKRSGRKDVRIHFVGVWDTVSSLGLIKREVHITESASVTNACHFRHALALDERRVKFMPEYFSEVNAHGPVRSPRSPVNINVEEVWFAGSHPDVGGTNRLDANGTRVDFHAGNAPLLWMRREAATNGLAFNPEKFGWGPKDIDLGRKDTMSFLWRLAEILPILHQVSFSGNGIHKRRLHWFHPRCVIPKHKIHSSVLSGDMYALRATLGDGHHIPTVPRESLGKLYLSEAPDEEATTRLLISLLSDQEKTLGSLGKVLFLLSSSNGQTIPVPQWLGTSVRKETGVAQFALTIIYDVITGFTVPDDLVHDARNSLSTTLSSTNQSSSPKPFDVLRFSSGVDRLRQRFIAHDNVIEALKHALDQTAKNPNENSFQLVVDTLCCLIKDDYAKDRVITQLSAGPRGSLSLALEVKAPRQLMASLKLIASCAQHLSGTDLQELGHKITKLAEKKKSPVGSAAVEALVALKASLTHNIPILSVLGYLGNTLPRLDVEGGSPSSPDNTGNLELPHVLKVNGSGEQLMHKLVSTIESRKARERTSATLTVLKLCRNSETRNGYSEKLMRIFVGQLKRKETSLLAAYALKSCLDLGMEPSKEDTTSYFDCAAQSIVAMLDNGWFDDAAGRVEGFDIFRGLMTYEELRKRVMTSDMVTKLLKKLEGGERDEVRMSSICLDILWHWSREDLESRVSDCVNKLSAKDKRTWNKSVKLLSALAQTGRDALRHRVLQLLTDEPEIGEKAIEPHVPGIMDMLLPPPDSPLVPHSRMRGPTSALYDLCKNETLREQIGNSDEFKRLKELHRADTPNSPLLASHA